MATLRWRLWAGNLAAREKPQDCQLPSLLILPIGKMGGQQGEGAETTHIHAGALLSRDRHLSHPCAHREQAGLWGRGRLTPSRVLLKSQSQGREPHQAASTQEVQHILLKSSPSATLQLLQAGLQTRHLQAGQPPGQTAPPPHHPTPSCWPWAGCCLPTLGQLSVPIPGEATRVPDAGWAWPGAQPTCCGTQAGTW